ncbi:MAG: FKBP-type peptidyl-prolyl cis-trans isomerase [Candidatus Staskawiczbacteria bacterium]|nr:FKBP-type peptidyl-prolyl cis-trans isomerase [Candidatus Staskawiczbacteria bacterium]
MSKVILIGIIILVVVIIIVLAVYLLGGTNSGLLGNPGSFDVQGVKVQITTQGSGTELKDGDTAVINYNGTLIDGSKFDSSYDRGTPLTFVLGSGQLIKGMDFGVKGMKVGEKRKITIPPELAYGERGIPPVIPPNSTLIFEVELMSFAPGK